MRLVGRNGNLLSLVPIGYEFPGVKADKYNDWIYGGGLN
jgi:hypothetical protein